MATLENPVLPVRLSSVVDAARYAGLHENTVRRWANEGLIRSWRVGPRSIRVDLDEIDRLLTPVER